MENKNRRNLGMVLGAATGIGFVLGLGKSRRPGGRRAAAEAERVQWEEMKRRLLQDQAAVEAVTGSFVKSWFLEHAGQNTKGCRLSVVRMTPKLAAKLVPAGAALDTEHYVLLALQDAKGDVRVAQLANFRTMSEKMKHGLDGGNGFLIVEG